MDAIEDRRIWKWLALLLVVLVVATGFAAQVSAGQDFTGQFQIVNPSAGETVEGDVTVMAYIPLGPGQRTYKNVDYSVGGGAWFPMKHIANGYYAAKWPTYFYQNGLYTLTVRYIVWSNPPAAYTTSIEVYVCQGLQPCINP